MPKTMRFLFATATNLRLIFERTNDRMLIRSQSQLIGLAIANMYTERATAILLILLSFMLTSLCPTVVMVKH